MTLLGIGDLKVVVVGSIEAGNLVLGDVGFYLNFSLDVSLNFI